MAGKRLGLTMKACLLRSPAAIETNPLEYADVMMPQPKSGEVLVRVRACGVCRTDLHVVEGELPPRKSPVIPGHQVVGTVEAFGPGARASRSRVVVAKGRDISRYANPSYLRVNRRRENERKKKPGRSTRNDVR